MRPDVHPGINQLPKPIPVDVPPLPNPPGKRKKLGEHPALNQPGQRNLNIGRITVIKGQMGTGTHHNLKQRLELLDGNPPLILPRIERTQRPANPVHRKGDHQQPPVRRTLPD